MKKLLSIVAIAAFMTACNDSSSKVDSTGTDSTKMSTDSTKPDTSATTTTPAATDTSKTMNSSAMMKDGMMTMKDGKMMVMKNGAWGKMEKAMTCTNGCKVMPNGEVTKGGKKKMMTEGMMIDKDGQMMDANGKMVDETAWK